MLEAHQQLTNPSEMVDWMDGNDYNCVRTEEPKQIENDYRKTQLIGHMGVYLLIDLTTMKVIEPKCGEKLDSGKQCVEDNL